MLAPLLLGTGMMFRTIRSNASLIFPRVGLLVVLLWVLWFVNSVVQNTVMYLRRQGAIDHRSAPAASIAYVLVVRHLPALRTTLSLRSHIAALHWHHCTRQLQSHTNGDNIPSVADSLVRLRDGRALTCTRRRVSGAVINASEMCSLGGALVIMLSIIGSNVSALLIPAGVALAIAAKDLSHNFLAGFSLFAVQVRRVAALPDRARPADVSSLQLVFRLRMAHAL